MSVVIGVLVVLHLLGAAAIIGPWLAAPRAGRIRMAMVWGARAQVVTGHPPGRAARDEQRPGRRAHPRQDRRQAGHRRWPLRRAPRSPTAGSAGRWPRLTPATARLAGRAGRRPRSSRRPGWFRRPRSSRSSTSASPSSGPEPTHTRAPVWPRPPPPAPRPAPAPTRPPRPDPSKGQLRPLWEGSERPELAWRRSGGRRYRGQVSLLNAMWQWSRWVRSEKYPAPESSLGPPML